MEYYSSYIFFIIIQTVFFIFVASKQFENILKDKLSFVKILSENNPYVYDIIQKIKSEYIVNKDYTSISLYREIYNNELLAIYCGIPMGIIFIFLVYILFRMKSEKSWDKVDSLSVFFVTLAYLTELFLFFCVITQYIFVGDQYIIYNFVSQLFH